MGSAESFHPFPGPRRLKTRAITRTPFIRVLEAGLYRRNCPPAHATNFPSSQLTRLGPREETSVGVVLRLRVDVGAVELFGELGRIVVTPPFCGCERMFARPGPVRPRWRARGSFSCFAFGDRRGLLRQRFFRVRSVARRPGWCF